MGNGCSLFGSPEHCSQCKTKELHACKWRVTYENAFITREAEKTIFSVGVTSLNLRNIKTEK